MSTGHAILQADTGLALLGNIKVAAAPIFNTVQFAGLLNGPTFEGFRIHAGSPVVRRLRYCGPRFVRI